MPTNSVVLGISIFSVLLMGYLFTLYDTQLCPSFTEFTETSINQTIQSTSFVDYFYNTKCDNLPGWYHLLIYGIFGIIILKSAITVS